MLSGVYVDRFSEASHALPGGMHMNSDYPLMLPAITALSSSHVTLKGSDGRGYTAPIRRQHGKEFCFIAQASSFERLFGRPPQRFKFHPFKDENTPAFVQPQLKFEESA